MKNLLVGVVLALSTAAFAEEASEIWKGKCKSCHGETGKANTKQGQKLKIPDLSTERWQSRHSDEKIKKVITHGEPDTKMKAYKEKLSEAEIDSLVVFVRGLKAPATAVTE